MSAGAAGAAAGTSLCFDLVQSRRKGQVRKQTMAKEAHNLKFENVQVCWLNHISQSSHKYVQ